ncbi:hypothetical protein [Nakamurella endophytica]|uniref:Uncharacterized protein n=1 Tax=Nakamurella endophytica TaxID=1748367 RepID=A0A917TA79_9ACTN|nr:hypothetical protein [Nakamurella endophytica]GGM15385.1 hypothetical protein GCM10011594_39300 [Nakamurella endophytica]
MPPSASAEVAVFGSELPPPEDDEEDGADEPDEPLADELDAVSVTDAEAIGDVGAVDEELELLDALDVVPVPLSLLEPQALAARARAATPAISPRRRRVVRAGVTRTAFLLGVARAPGPSRTQVTVRVVPGVDAVNSCRT